MEILDVVVRPSEDLQIVDLECAIDLEQIQGDYHVKESASRRQNVQSPLIA